MKQMSPKPCVLDPIPMSVLVLCSDQIDPLLTPIANQCLLTSSFHSCIKASVVKPLLKKTSFDPNVLKNVRPVLNLFFVSKLSEKIVLDQLLCHLDQNNLWHTFQPAYRHKHSTKTALLRVFNEWRLLQIQSRLSEKSQNGASSILTALTLIIYPSDSPRKHFWYLWSCFVLLRFLPAR